MTEWAFPGRSAREALQPLIGEARRRQRRRQTAITFCLLLATGLGVGVYLAIFGRGSSPPGSLGVRASGSHGSLVSSVSGAATMPPIANVRGWVEVWGGRMTVAFGSLWLNSATVARASEWQDSTVGPSTVSRVDPASGRMLASIRLAQSVGGEITSGFGSVWAVAPGAGTVSRIDPSTNTVTATISTQGASPVAITTSPQAVWVTNQGGSSSSPSVVEIDPATNRVVATVPLAARPSWIAYAGGSLWADDSRQRRLIRIDPASARIVASIPSPATSAPSYAAGDGRGALWFTTSGKAGPHLLRLDPATGTITTAIQSSTLRRRQLQNIDGLAFGGGSLWLSGYCGMATKPYQTMALFCLLRIDPGTNAIASIRGLPTSGPRNPEQFVVSLAYAGQSLWFAAVGVTVVFIVDPHRVVVCGPYRWHGHGMFAPDCHVVEPKAR